MKQVRAEVRSNRPAGAYFLMELACPQLNGAKPGQFVMVDVPPADLILPRPFAMVTADASGFSILYAVVGKGTEALSRARPGDALRVTGPLGKPFTVKKDARYHFVVAGGTGVAATIVLARELAEARIGPTVFVCGSRDRDRNIPDGVEPAGVELLTCTEDGSMGMKGTALEAATRELDRRGTEGAAVYAAGPWGMLKALAGHCEERGVPLQVSLEERMACGTGLCRGCAVRARTPHPETGLPVRLVCSDGPVFDSREIEW